MSYATNRTLSPKTRYHLPLNLQLFAEGDPESNPQDDTKPPKVEFTAEQQAAIDAMVKERLARDRKGREDYDDIKAKLAQFEEKESEVTAVKQQLAADKEAAEKRAQEAEEAKAKAFEAANQRLIRAEFKALASTESYRIRPDALEDAIRLADLANVSVDESGNVVGLEDAIKSLVEAKSYLVDKAPTNRQIGGDTNGGNRKVETDGLTSREKIRYGYNRS